MSEVADRVAHLLTTLVPITKEDKFQLRKALLAPWHLRQKVPSLPYEIPPYADADHTPPAFAIIEFGNRN